LHAEVERDGGFDDGKCSLDVRILSFLLKHLETLPLALILISFSSMFGFLNLLLKKKKIIKQILNVKSLVSITHKFGLKILYFGGL